MSIRSRNKKYPKRVPLQLGEVELARLDRWAKDHGLTRNAAIRLALAAMKMTTIRHTIPNPMLEEQ